MVASQEQICVKGPELQKQCIAPNKRVVRQVDWIEPVVSGKCQWHWRSLEGEPPHRKDFPAQIQQQWVSNLALFYL